MVTWLPIHSRGYAQRPANKLVAGEALAGAEGGAELHGAQDGLMVSDALAHEDESCAASY